MGRHVALAFTDTNVGALNALASSIEISLCNTNVNQFSILDFGLENLLTNNEIAIRSISNC